MYGIMQSICICGLWAAFACGVGVLGVGVVVVIYLGEHWVGYTNTNCSD